MRADLRGERRQETCKCDSLCSFSLPSSSLPVVPDGRWWLVWLELPSSCSLRVRAVWCGGGQCEREGMVESGCGGGQCESVVAATRLVIVSNNKHLLGYKTYIPNIDN